MPQGCAHCWVWWSRAPSFGLKVWWSEFSGGTVELVRMWIWLWDIFDWLLQDSQVSLLHLLLNPYFVTMRFRCSLACHYYQNLWQQQFLQTALCVAPSQVLLNCRILSNLMNNEYNSIIYIYGMIIGCIPYTNMYIYNIHVDTKNIEYLGRLVVN